MAVRLARPLLEPELPPGYSLQSASGDGITAILALEQFDCDSLVIANDTVIAPISWAVTIAAAEPDERPSNAKENGVYQFEWFIDNATAAALLTARGLNAYYASVSGHQDSEEVSVNIEVDGNTWYDVEGRLGNDLAPPSQYSESHFHGSDYSFAELHYESAIGGLPPFVAGITASDGIFSRLGTGYHPSTLLSGPVAVRVGFPPP